MTKKYENPCPVLAGTCEGKNWKPKSIYGTSVKAARQPRLRVRNHPSAPLSGPLDVWRACADFRAEQREFFAVFCLDASHRVILREVVSVGTLTESLVHPREVFRQAIACGAAAIIAVHNHPSGNFCPSPQDREVTARLKKAGVILGILVLDHVIVSSTGHGRAV